MKILPFIHACICILSMLLVSCDRQKLLLREKERLEAEYNQATAEIQVIEQRMLSLGTQVAAASVNLERQAATAEQKAIALEVEIGTLESKAEALETATKEFSARVDVYKAKHLR